MVLCNTRYLIKTHARQLWKQCTKIPPKISETTITYDLAHYTFRVFILLQWNDTTSYYNHAKGYTAKGREGRGPARQQRDWLKEQIAATPQDFSPSSAARERAGWWPWSHSCQALNHRSQTLDAPDGVCWADRKADNLRPLPRARCDGDRSECQPEMPAPGWLSSNICPCVSSTWNQTPSLMALCWEGKELISLWLWLTGDTEKQEPIGAQQNEAGAARPSKGTNCSHKLKECCLLNVWCVGAFCAESHKASQGSAEANLGCTELSPRWNRSQPALGECVHHA